MAACKVVHASVTSALEQIYNAQTSLTNAGGDFEEAFKAAIAPMEGEAKDALLAFFDKTIVPFVRESLPGAVEGMHALLQANLDNFVDVDTQLAGSIGGQG